VAATVLVADDDPDIRDLLEFKLTHCGYKVHVAEDGPSALAAALEYKPDLAVLDIMMPVMSGLDVARTLRENHETAAMSILMLTARAQESDVARGFGVGADDYVLKPFSPRELISRIEAILTRVAR